MERPSDSDSDDDESYRRLGSLVLRPAITSLPSIGDDNDTDGGDSSSDTEVLFSNINWAAQESAGLLFDQEPGSPGPLRPETNGNAPTGARPLSGAIGTTAGASTVHSPPGPQPSVAASPRHGLTAANTVALDHAVGTPSGAPKRVGPPTPSATSTPSPSAGGEGAGAGHVWDDDPDELYEGRGWLAGAAGRLANVAERRRANAAATDEEHVAAAARHAAALRQHRQQLQQQLPLNARAGSGAVAGDTSGLASPSAAATAASSGALEQQQQLQMEREEVERRILRDFQEAIRAADSEPPLVASRGLSLESTVAGLGLEDLDALIARLAAGTADLRPPGGQGAAAGPSSTAAAAEPGAAAIARPWALEPLPAADSLWSDEEDEAVEAAAAGGGQAGRSEGVTAAVERVARVSPEWGPAAAVGGELPAPAATLASVPTAIAPSAASAPAAAAPSPPAIALPVEGAPPGPPHLPGPLPAKFKFFAGPGAPVAAPPLPAVAGGGSGGSGPIVQDLRQSIVEAAQRNSRDAAAVAAQRQSEAKAAAARRRLVADSDSSDDGSGDDDGAVARKVRPVPLGQAPPPAAPQPSPPQPPPQQQQQPAAPAVPAVPPRPAAPTAAATGASSTTTTAASTMEHAGRAVARFPPGDWSESSAEVTLGGCGGAAPAAPRCVSVGTDAADLRPASRSVFVCTSERKAEEEERVQDIREYLKARAAAAAAAARAEAEAEAEQLRQRAPQEPPAERRWPEPPAAVTERIAVLAERQAVASTAAAAAAEAQKPAKPRVVATFAGGDNDSSGLANGTSGGSTAKDAAAASANGNGTATAAATAEAAMSPAASAATGPRSFAACSTEGDEDLVAEPPPASVSDASTERGARMAAAGTVIPLARAPAAPSSPGSASRGAVATSAASTTAKSETASADPASKRSVAAATAAAAPARRAAPGAPSVAAAGVPAGATRPAALQLPSPVSASADADVAASAVAYVSPVGLSPAASADVAAAAAAAPAKSPGAAAPADLCRLPAWLSQGSYFTLMLTSPRNLPSLEVGAALEWLLLRQPSLPAFSVVGARLLAVPQSWPLLPAAAAAAAVQQPAGPASAGVLRAGGGGSGSAGDAVRVLAVACVPRAGVDADAYSHELPATAAADAEAAGFAARQLTEALAAVPWAAMFATADGDGSCPAATGQGCGALLSGWVSAQPGAQLLFSPLRLPPHAFSHHQPRASDSTVTSSAAAITSPNGAANGSTTFVSVVTAGGLRDPHLIRRLLERAACLGLTLRGLQVVYATEEAAAAVVASTPHRPLPYTGAAVLALSGRNEPLRRWQAQLGPPEARLACRTDPTSLHALYGNVAQHITCSYDGASAARELTALFSVAVGGGDGQPPASSPSPSPRQQQQQLRLAPAHATPAPQRGVAGDGPAATAVAAAAVCSLAASGQPEAQWLALPACGAAQQVRALWCLQRLLWCGYSLRGLLLMRLPSEPQPAPAPARAPQGHSQEQSPALVLEVSKEEATNQLPLLLAAVPPLPPASGKIAAAGCPPPAVRSLLPPDALRARLAPSDVQSLPQPYVAEQLLVAAAGDAALDPADDDGGGDDGGGGLAAAASLHFHHGEDGIAVVALQARPLHAAALLLAALVSHATGTAAAAAAAAAPELPSADRLELVACRYLRQVPSDVANCLAVLHPYHLGAAAAASTAVPATGTAGGVGASARAAQRLVISQPALLAVFHGPAAQTRVTRWLATGLQRLHGAPDQSTMTATASAGDQDAVWATLLDQLHRDYPPVAALAAASPAVAAAATPPPPVAAVSGSQAAAKRALSYGFGPAHVFLDAGLHNGLHRPPLPPQAASSAAAAAAAASAATPLFRLLAGPEPLLAVVALDFAALHRNLLPRLVKQLWREGYSLHAAATCHVQPGGSAAAAMPALGGKPAVLLHVSRSNAVQHLRAMAAALAAGGGGLHTCQTWRDAVAVVAEVWPQRPPADAEGQVAAGAGVVLAQRGAAAAAGPARRFVRPEGSRLLQLTAMVVTPAAPSSGTGTATPSLDWPRLADALEALHSEGFRLGAVRAAAATPRDLADLARVSCRVSPAQQYAVHASAAAPAAASAAAAAAPPPPCNLVLLALARDSAVTSLQLLLDEASRAAAAELRQGQGQGSAAAAAAGSGGVLPAAMAGRGPTGGRREAVAALAAVAPCVSVAHSPAAAEAQVVAVFDDVFGAGGVALLQ